MVKHLLAKKIGAVFCSVALAASMCPVVAFAGQVGAEDAQASAKTTQEAAATALSVSQADAFEADGQYVITAQEDSTTYAMDSDLTADEITVDNGTISASDGSKDLTELTWVYEAGDTYGYLKNASTGEYLYYSQYDYRMSTSADEKDTISYENERLSISYVMWDYAYSDKIVLSYGSEFVAESYSTGMTITLYKVSEGGSQSCEHAWVDTVVAPTCTEKGYMLHACSKCNREKKDAYVDALDHDYEGVEWTVVSEPTCTVDGQQQRGCTRCDYLDKQAIAKLGHDFTKLTDLGDKHRVSCARL